MKELTKICKECGMEKTIDNFYVNRKTFYLLCKKCVCNIKKHEYNPILGKEKRKIFLNKNPLYHTWLSMKKRCYNHKANNFKRYGGRGIKVCERWLVYKNFEKDMFPTFKSGLSMDRIDNNGNYCLENCKWSTPLEQANNRRSNHPITFKGKTMNLTQWARFIGIDHQVLSARLNGRGWSIERILTTTI